MMDAPRNFNFPSNSILDFQFSLFFTKINFDNFSQKNCNFFVMEKFNYLSNLTLYYFDFMKIMTTAMVIDRLLSLQGKKKYIYISHLKMLNMFLFLRLIQLQKSTVFVFS